MAKTLFLLAIFAVFCAVVLSFPNNGQGQNGQGQNGNGKGKGKNPHAIKPMPQDDDQDEDNNQDVSEDEDQDNSNDNQDGDSNGGVINRLARVLGCPPAPSGNGTQITVMPLYCFFTGWSG